MKTPIKLPVKVIPTYVENYRTDKTRAYLELRDADEQRIFRIKDDVDGEADAVIDFIANAMNRHEDLVAVCEAFISQTDVEATEAGKPVSPQLTMIDRSTIDAARAAVARAKGQVSP